MKRHFGKEFLIIISLIFLSIFLTCKKKNEHSKITKTHSSISNFETINLTQNIIIKRFSDGKSKYWDILEFNKNIIDTIQMSCMIDTTEENIFVRNKNHFKSFIIIDDYLIISKNLIQTLWVQVYNLKSNRKLTNFNTEQFVVDTDSKEIFLIRERGIENNCILKFKLQNNQLIKLDSFPNNDEIKSRLNIKL